jgi:hypothetical protein
MKIVNYTDKKGYLRASKIKEDDPDSFVKHGIPVEVPDLEKMLDWDGFKRDLHNALMRAELYTLEDVRRSGTRFAPALTVLKRYLMVAYTSDYETSEITQDNNSSGG